MFSKRVVFYRKISGFQGGDLVSVGTSRPGNSGGLCRFGGFVVAGVAEIRGFPVKSLLKTVGVW